MLKQLSRAAILSLAFITLAGPHWTKWCGNSLEVTFKHCVLCRSSFFSLLQCLTHFEILSKSVGLSSIT